jgi:hypothetical protein
MLPGNRQCARRKSGRGLGTLLCIALFVPSVAVWAQGDTGSAADLPPLDESQYSNSPNQSGQPDLGPSPDFEEGENEEENGIPTAVIEGVQISAEPGERPGEKIISGYFIFKDKPSSYFYEVKLKDKQIVFEFNDTRTSGAPVPSVAEPPIKGFTVEDRKINVNKDIKGLKPEYHNQIRVIFNAFAVPIIRVTDEYNVISFSYKWTTDSTKLDKYVIKPAKKWPWWVGGGTVVAGGGVAAWVLTRPKKIPELEELSITDLPVHVNR